MMVIDYKKKISVVIPTIWKGDNLFRLLSDISKVERIDEILIIDNSPSDINLDINMFPKIKRVEMEENIYVNPAWNLGVDLVKNEIVCLLQDDVFFDAKFVNDINVEDETLIGVDRKNFPPFEVTYDPKVIDCDMRDWGYATILIFKKNSYIKIPDDLKIWCGDDFLFDKFRIKKSILGLPLETKMSVTSNLSIFDEIRQLDLINYEKYK